MEHRLYPAALQAFAAGDLTVEGERIIGQTVALFDPEA
jgi:folate-dependent phosphoribosylglycinamide formyltransferase PurN